LFWFVLPLKRFRIPSRLWGCFVNNHL
jgi:hypothetical protein